MVERFSTCVYFDANSKNSGLCASSELFQIVVHILHFKDDQLWIYNSYIHHCDHSTELTKRYVKLWNWLIDFSQFFIHKFFGFLYSLSIGNRMLAMLIGCSKCWLLQRSFRSKCVTNQTRLRWMWEIERWIDSPCCL